MRVAQIESTDKGKTWSSHPRVLKTAKGISFWLERRDGKSQLAVNGKTLAML